MSLLESDGGLNFVQPPRSIPAWDIAMEGDSAGNYLFNEAWYRRTFEDVAALIDSGKVSSGFAHYRAVGYTDRSPNWLFSEAFYRMNYPDLTRSYLENRRFWNGYDHFLQIGDWERRQGSLFFDPQLYLKNLSTEIDIEFISPFVHFAKNGFRNDINGRLSWYFDADWYVRAYPEISGELGGGGQFSSALEHYLCNQNPQAFDPSRFFSEAFYLSTYPDIRLAIEREMFRNGYDHFIQHGVFERRRPHPEIDLEDYFRNVSVQADIQRGLFRDAYAHYVADQEAPKSRREIAANEYQVARLAVAQAQNLAITLARRPLDFSCNGPPKLCVVISLHRDISLNLLALSSLAKAVPRNETELVILNAGLIFDAKEFGKFVEGISRIEAKELAVFLKGNDIAELSSAPAILLLDGGAMIDGDAIEAALERLFSADDIGAVGGKVISGCGVLEEAGGIVWQDGSVSGYLAGQPPSVPEANFIRHVDFCASFLLLKRESIQEKKTTPAHLKIHLFCLIDFCVWLQQAGWSVVYDPAVQVIKHFSAPSVDQATDQKLLFADINKDFVESRYERWNGNTIEARHASQHRRSRILFIEDRIPFRYLGSGYTRSNDIIRTFVQLDYHVTVFPIFKAVENCLQIYREFSDHVEVIFDRELPDLALFLEERAGYYDVIWVGRTQNSRRVLEALTAAGSELPHIRRVLDTEAVGAVRTHLKNKVHERENFKSLLVEIREELKHASQFDIIVAVNQDEEKFIREAGFDNVAILGHAQRNHMTANSFEERKGILFVGSIHDDESPNLDSLLWFVNSVLPKLTLALHLEEPVRFTIAGYLNKQVNLSKISRANNVEILGAQDDLTSIYNQHRVFVAPTRFAAGIPYKLHEAAAHGIPIVASAFLAKQLEWQTERELLTADPNEPESFVRQIARLYCQRDLWNQLRQQAISEIETNNSYYNYKEHVKAILTGVPSRSPIN